MEYPDYPEYVALYHGYCGNLRGSETRCYPNGCSIYFNLLNFLTIMKLH